MVVYNKTESTVTQQLVHDKRVSGSGFGLDLKVGTPAAAQLTRTPAVPLDTAEVCSTFKRAPLALATTKCVCTPGAHSARPGPLASYCCWPAFVPRLLASSPAFAASLGGLRPSACMPPD